jgi:hypothetical protein
MRVCLTTGVLAVAGVLLVFAPTAHGQWLDYKTPGIPRMADGKPNLTAPAPRTHDGTPDLSGIWEANGGGYGLNIAIDLKPAEIQPWAKALYQQRQENLGKDFPPIRCLPDLGPMISLGMYKILQTPSAIAFLAEGEYRQVLTDGRPLPKDPNPSWQGYSVGHWEGDTLVIESAGFNELTWLDAGGHPHSEALRVTERFHRRDFGHMDLKITFEDPKAYTRPWTIAVNVEMMPDTELLEYICNENERDSKHIVITEEDRKKSRQSVRVAPEILAKYAGKYQPVDPSGHPLDRDGKPVGPGGKPEWIVVTLEGDQLMAATSGGGGKIALPAETETMFSVLGTKIEFVKNDQGAVTHLITHAVEGDFKSIRTGNAP